MFINDKAITQLVIGKMTVKQKPKMVKCEAEEDEEKEEDEEVVGRSAGAGLPVCETGRSRMLRDDPVLCLAANKREAGCAHAADSARTGKDERSPL